MGGGAQECQTPLWFSPAYSSLWPFLMGWGKGTEREVSRAGGSRASEDLALEKRQEPWTRRREAGWHCLATAWLWSLPLGVRVPISTMRVEDTRLSFGQNEIKSRKSEHQVLGWCPINICWVCSSLTATVFSNWESRTAAKQRILMAVCSPGRSPSAVQSRGSAGRRGRGVCSVCVGGGNWELCIREAFGSFNNWHDCTGACWGSISPEFIMLEFTYVIPMVCPS